MSRPHTRDLAITAVVCFIGGVGLTLLVVLVFYQVYRKKKQKESERQMKEEEESSSVISNHVNHVDVSEKRRDVFSGQTLDRKAMMLENHSGPFWSGGDEDGSHVRCLDCTKRQRGVWPNQMRRNNGINREREAEEEREKRRMRLMMMMTEEERRKPGTQQGILSRDVPNKLLSPGNSNSFSPPWREAFSERPETLTAYKTDRHMDVHRTDVEGRSDGYETLHCESCQRTYRPPEHTMRSGRIHSNNSALFDGFPPEHRRTDVGRNVNYNQFDMMRNTDFRRESRHVTFDLEPGGDRREERGREKGRKRRQKVKTQSPGKLKAKLNTLRKSKVHPKRRSEQGHSDHGSSRKSKEKRRDEKEKEREEGKSKSGRKTKGSGEKVMKSKKRAGLSEDDDETKEDEEGKSKITSKQKKVEDTAADKEEKTNPADTTTAADQSASASAIGQGQHLPGGSIRRPETGLLLRNAQLSSQHPSLLSAADRNRTANLSLLGPADSHLTGSSLSLQGGSGLLNTLAPGSNAPFPNGQANSVAPIVGPSLASSGVNSINRQTGAGLLSLANSVYANPLQALQTLPLHNSQDGGASNKGTNPSVNPRVTKRSQSLLAPGGSPLGAGPQKSPAQAPGPQTVEGQPPLALETLAARTEGSLPVQALAAPGSDGLSGVTPQTPGSVATVERVSDIIDQAEHVPGGSTDRMSAGGVALPGGAAVGVSGDSAEAANVSVSGVGLPGPSTDADGAAALLQQEYVSEEGDSSPRRKLRLVLPEKTSSRPPTALERKIR